MSGRVLLAKFFSQPKISTNFPAKMSQQTGTQSGGNRGKNTIPDYIQRLNAQARKLGTNDASQGLVPQLEKAITELSENNCTRLNKLISYLCKESATDDCKFLTESAVLFFRILDVCSVDTNEARRFYLSAFLDNLFTGKADLNAFVDIRNLFAEQSVKLPIAQLYCVIKSVTSTVMNATEKTVNEQWLDCVSILVSRLLRSTDGGKKTGPKSAPCLLGRWLREAANTTAFASIVAIIDKCGVSHILREYIHVDLQKELDSFENLNENTAIDKENDNPMKIKEEDDNDDLMSEYSTQTAHSFRTHREMELEEKLTKTEEKLQRAINIGREFKVLAEAAESRFDSKYESEKKRSKQLELKLEEANDRFRQQKIMYETKNDTLSDALRRERKLTREKMNLNKELAARDDRGKKLQKRNDVLLKKLAQYERGVNQLVKLQHPVAVLQSGVEVKKRKRMSSPSMGGNESDKEDESKEDSDEDQEIDREESDGEEISDEDEEPSEQNSEERSGDDEEKEKKMETRSLTKPPQKKRFRRGDYDSEDEDEDSKGQVPKKRQR